MTALEVVVDTCGWVEWLTDGPLAERFRPYLADPTRIIVPTVVQYELHKWLCRERDEQWALEVIGVTERGRVVPLDGNLALFAADLSRRHALAMADAMIYATAQLGKVELITADDHFEGLPGVLFFRKSAS
ncbi:PIN domain-containing protein [Endothiovibrio diazotrophicus]